MKYAGHIRFRFRQIAPDLWEALFKCPADELDCVGPVRRVL